METETVTAGILIIGDEILSGRTQDTNLATIARFLALYGIDLSEVRVVPDVEDEIVAAVNALRARYTYVFTTGGIGPTHDDITADAIGKAFGVAVDHDPAALALLAQRYRPEDFNQARRRMARVPKGASLIANPVSVAPGFQIGNVFVLAGVPRIMQAMLDDVGPRLKRVRPVISRSVTLYAPEGSVAAGLASIQAAHDGIVIGSYPFFAEPPRPAGTVIVVRGRERSSVEAALEALRSLAKTQNIAFDEAAGTT